MVLSRREFFFTGAAFAASPMTSKERVDRALGGTEADRPPFTFWHHFGLEKFPGARHAEATLAFHRKFRTDLVKVMSDYPYPGRRSERKVFENPFPEQIRALEIIRDGLGGKAYFLETIFNPWNVLEKASSKEEVLRAKNERPQQLLDDLEAVAKSEANHAKLAVRAGAAGIFLAIANAQDGMLSQADYAKFSEPFDKMVFDAVRGAPLNTLHLHGDKVYLERFYKGWSAAVLNYSAHGTGVPLAAVRRRYSGVLMAGLDETNFRKLSAADLKKQSNAAREAAGKRFILAPGCSVPNESTDAELSRLPRLLGA